MTAEEKRKRIGTVLRSLADGIAGLNGAESMFDDMRESLGAVMPDPFDPTTYASALLLQEENGKLHGRVKVLEGENKNLEHENRDVRHALREITDVRLNTPSGPIHICQGCGVRGDGSSHKESCLVNNALNPKPAKPEAPADCPDCVYERPCEAGENLCVQSVLAPWPRCNDVSNDDCDFRAKPEPEAELPFQPTICSDCKFEYDHHYCGAVARREGPTTEGTGEPQYFDKYGNLSLKKYPLCADTNKGDCQNFKEKAEPATVVVSCENCDKSFVPPNFSRACCMAAGRKKAESRDSDGNQEYITDAGGLTGSSHRLCQNVFKEDCGSFEPKGQADL